MYHTTVGSPGIRIRHQPCRKFEPHPSFKKQIPDIVRVVLRGCFVYVVLKDPQIRHLHTRPIGVDSRTFLEEVFCDFRRVDDDGVKPWNVKRNDIAYQQFEISVLELDNDALGRERRTVISLGPVCVFDVRPLLWDIKEISDEEMRARSWWIRKSVGIASTVFVCAYTREYYHDSQCCANGVVHRIEHTHSD